MPNLYATLGEYKSLITSPGNTLSTDAPDDISIVRMLGAASRFIDSGEGANRKFYPRIDTRYYDMPGDEDLWLDDDLLSPTILTNGDLTVIDPSDYILRPRNSTPYYEIKIKDSSSVFWQYDSSGSAEDVISLLGIWGYHESYPYAWPSSGAVLTAEMTGTAVLTFACTTGLMSPGHIIKIGSEIMNVTAVTVGATDTVTVQFRGDNGSTAATHLIASVVYVWQTDLRINDACLQIAKAKYDRRYGQNQTDASIITAGGIVISPKDIPGDAYRNIKALRRVV